MKTKFTDKQLKDWSSFERVRTSGRYNMHDPRARRATGLDGGAYSFVMQNFSRLRASVEEQEAA